MSNAKIEFTLDGISFSGEGEEFWVANQLDKIIEKIPELLKIAPEPPTPTKSHVDNTSHTSKKDDAAIVAQTLPNFLKEKNASRNQVVKFLATAVWLGYNGKNRFVTGDVTRALKDSNQTSLNNPSVCRACNISKGYIERNGKDYFVTTEGKASL